MVLQQIFESQVNSDDRSQGVFFGAPAEEVAPHYGHQSLGEPHGYLGTGVTEEIREQSPLPSSERMLPVRNVIPGERPPYAYMKLAAMIIMRAPGRSLIANETRLDVATFPVLSRPFYPGCRVQTSIDTSTGSQGSSSLVRKGTIVAGRSHQRPHRSIMLRSSIWTGNDIMLGSWSPTNLLRFSSPRNTVCSERTIVMFTNPRKCSSSSWLDLLGLEWKAFCILLY